jgi:hypothetical protein
MRQCSLWEHGRSVAQDQTIRDLAAGATPLCIASNDSCTGTRWSATAQDHLISWKTLELVPHEGPCREESFKVCLGVDGPSGTSLDDVESKMDEDLGLGES